MKKIIYFLASVILFVVLFYKQGIGINLSLFAITLLTLSWKVRKKNSISKNFKWALVGAVISSISYAYYADFSSFLLMFISMHWIAMDLYDPKQEMIKGFILVPINYLIMLMNIYQFPLFHQKQKKIDSVSIIKKVVAYGLIPFLIVCTFIVMYSSASSALETLFNSFNFSFDLDIAHLLFLLIFGSVLMFGFWFFRIPPQWKIASYHLPDDYKNREFQASEIIDMIRKSGEITFILLNIVLLIFIGIYGAENFLMITVETLSETVHQRVYTIILSIVLAISLILYFFREEFIFNPKNKRLIQLSNYWIYLNAILVLVALFKNAQYVHFYGLTEKRLGVFTFLILCWVGLYFTYIKLKNKKSNWYIIHRMSKAFYIVLIFVAFFNWSYLITQYNIAVNKIDNDIYYHVSMKYNDLSMYKYYKKKKEIKGVERQKEVILMKSEIIRLDSKLYDFWVKYNID